MFDWPTAAGSKLWANSVARKDATAVARLRQAGAVVLGKTVTTAYASFDPPPTRNPWDPAKTPGGSSSGSAAAVACGMCLAALATQTGGSITRPASYCGVCSLKPTYGRIPTTGVVPLAAELDHVGVIANCVADLTLVYRPLVDRFVGSDPWPFVPGEGPRFAKAGGLFDEMMEAALREPFAAACRTLDVERTALLPAEFADVLPRHRTTMAVGAAQFHGERLRRHPDDYPPNITRLIREGLETSAPEYRRCVEHRRALSLKMDDLLATGDILMTPGATGPAPDAATTGDPAFNSPWSYTGLPTVSVPFGWTADGLPLAVQFVGCDDSDADLLRAAAVAEARLGFVRRTVS